MTDLQRIELAARRLAQREGIKQQKGEPYDLSFIRVFQELADELAKMPPLKTADRQ